MHVPFLDLAKQNSVYKQEFAAAMLRVVQSPTTILGPEVNTFETRWAEYCHAKHCVGTGNGYDAMRLMLEAFGIGRYCQVIVASNTHIATWLAVLAVGAEVVVAEPNPDTMVLDVKAVQKVQTRRCRAVLATPLYGIPVGALSIEAATGLPVFLDAAQGHGLVEVGTAAAFSFYPTKNLGALGDGGAVVCNDQDAADTMYHLRNYGARKQNQHEVIGCNSRLDELQAAVLNIKLRDLNSNNARRREIADCYRTALRNSTLRLPPAGVFHQYVVRHMRRDQFRAKLAARGVDTLIHYPTPPHLQRAMQHLGFREGDFPIAEAMSRECLSLPIGPELTQKQVEYVIEMVRECV